VTDRIKQLLPLIQDDLLFSQHDFRLVGGTALSYHINHRISEDLDFCLTEQLPLEDIAVFTKSCTERFGFENIEYIEPSRAMIEAVILAHESFCNQIP